MKKRSKLAKVIEQFDTHRQQEIMQKLSNEIKVRESIKENLFDIIKINLTSDALLLQIDRHVLAAALEGVGFEPGSKAKGKLLDLTIDAYNLVER